MDLQGKKLDEWFLELEALSDFSKFPHGENYPNKYKTISEQLYKWVHPEVGVGSAIADASMLTNHGNDHIKTLINRASQFLDKNEFCILSPFEVYILLMAIHVHDVGNILGRKGHEINAKAIIDKLKPFGLVGQDDWIWEYIYDIAKAHKGNQIQMLAYSDHLHEVEFRPQFLAAIVKFADELAENFARSSKINLDLENVPEENLLFHHYASCINSIIPDPNTREIKMIFNLKEDLLCRKFQKEGEEIYLIDEIYLRTLKTYSEKAYCMKFMRPLINFDTIRVTLNIKKNNGDKIQNGYELAENGFDNINMDEVFKLCPELKQHTGELIHKQLTGK